MKRRVRPGARMRKRDWKSGNARLRKVKQRREEGSGAQKAAAWMNHRAQQEAGKEPEVRSAVPR